MKSKIIFEEKINGYEILADFENHTFLGFHKGIKRSNGYWKIDDGKVVLLPLEGNRELFSIRGIILQETQETKNWVLLKKNLDDGIAIFSSDGKDFAVNFRDGVVAVQDGKGVIETNGCFSVTNTGSIILDPVIGENGKREKKKILEIRGLFLQNKEDERNLILIKKKE